MRTNIIIDDTLMKKAMKVTGIKTKKETVETALKELLRATETKSALLLRGNITWSGDLDEWRK